MDRSEAAKTVLFAAMISVLFVCAVFLSDIISYVSTVLSIMYIILSAAIYGFCLISRNRIIWLVKWGLSLPLSYIVFNYFQTYHYSIRALNRVFPDYGRQTAGGAFAMVGLFFMLCILCAVSGIAAMFIKPKNTAVFSKVQLITAVCAGGITVAAVLLLEQQFPPYEYIEAYINS